VTIALKRASIATFFKHQYLNAGRISLRCGLSRYPRLSAIGTKRTFAALQQFGRYWGHSGQKWILACNGLSAYDLDCVKTHRWI
jgi:hypothetical protein